MLSFSACGSKKVDISDYIESAINVSGADGYGKADPDSFDDMELVDDIVNNCLTSKNTDPFTAKIDLYGDIDLELNQDYENLKNGDKIDLTLTYDEAAFKAYGIRFKNKSGDVLEYEIHDLPELGSFDPFEDLDYTITGYNGYATIEVSNKSESNNIGFKIEGADILNESSLSKLSNNDKITVKAVIRDFYTYTDEELTDYCIENLLSKPTRTEMEIEVKDLKDPKTIDLFGDEYLEISESGISGDGKLTLKSKKNNGIYYFVSKSSYLSNGDEITVNASNYDLDYTDEYVQEELTNYCLENFDAVPKEFTYTYTVKKLDYHATAVSQIPEDTMNLMKNTADDVRTAEFADSEKESLISSDYLGAYLLHAKDIEAYPSYGESHNKIYLIYKNKVSNTDGEFTYYWYICYNNVQIKNNGTAYVDVTKYYNPSTKNDGCLITKSGFYYPGYEKFDVLYEKLVNSKLDYYDCDSTVKE